MSVVPTLVPILAVADTVQIATIVGAAALIQTMVSGAQTKRAKQADDKRQDDVAKKVEEARVAKEANDKVVADEAARQQEQVASVAREAAALLQQAQASTRADSDEVARIAADKAAAPEVAHRSKLLAVVISHPSGVQRVVELDGVPSKGEHILLRGARQGDQPQKVANVLWVEANGGQAPSVIVVVCPAEAGTSLLSEATAAARHHEDA